jgi:hypothetical protein
MTSPSPVSVDFYSALHFYEINLHSSSKWDHSIFFFYASLTSFNILFSRSIHVATNDRSSCLMAACYFIFHILHIFFYLSLCWWTFRLSLYPAYFAQHCSNMGPYAIFHYVISHLLHIYCFCLFFMNIHTALCNEP